MCCLPYAVFTAPMLVGLSHCPGGGGGGTLGISAPIQDPNLYSQYMAVPPPPPPPGPLPEKESQPAGGELVGYLQV